MNTAPAKLPHEASRQPVKRLPPQQPVYGLKIKLKGEFEAERWLAYIDDNIDEISALVKRYCFVQLNAKQFATSSSESQFVDFANSKHEPSDEEWHPLESLRRTMLYDPLELLQMNAKYFLNEVNVPEDAPGRRKLAERIDKKIKQLQSTSRYNNKSLETYFAQRYQAGRALFFGHAVAHASENDWENFQLPGHIHPQYAIVGIAGCNTTNGLKKLRKCWQPTSWEDFYDNMTGSWRKTLLKKNERAKYYFWKAYAKAKRVADSEHSP